MIIYSLVSFLVIRITLIMLWSIGRQPTFLNYLVTNFAFWDRYLSIDQLNLKIVNWNWNIFESEMGFGVFLFFFNLFIRGFNIYRFTSILHNSKFKYQRGYDRSVYYILLWNLIMFTILNSFKGLQFNYLATRVNYVVSISNISYPASYPIYDINFALPYHYELPRTNNRRVSGIIPHTSTKLW